MSVTCTANCASLYMRLRWGVGLESRFELKEFAGDDMFTALHWDLLGDPISHWEPRSKKQGAWYDWRDSEADQTDKITTHSISIDISHRGHYVVGFLRAWDHCWYWEHTSRYQRDVGSIKSSERKTTDIPSWLNKLYATVRLLRAQTKY